MPEYLSAGVYFTEPRSPIAEIVGNSTSVGAMHGIAEMGPIDDPILVGSFEEYVKIFGGFITTSHLPVSVKAFFDNGGRALYVSRAGHYTDVTDISTLDAVVGTLQLQDGTPTNDALMAASFPGIRGNDITVSTTKIDTQIGVINGALIIAVAITSIKMDDVRRVYVGSTLSVTSGGTIRVVVTKVDPGAKLVHFVSTTPSAGVADAAPVLLEEWKLSYSLLGTFKETIGPLAMDATAGAFYFLDKINNNDPTRLIVVETDNGVAVSNTVDPRPADLVDGLIGTTTAGSDGSTIVDADFVGSSAGKTGLYSFDLNTDISLLASPGNATTVVHNGLITYAEGREDLLVCASPNTGLTVAAALTYVQTTANLYSEYLHLSFPWVSIPDPVSGLLTNVPPEGFVMGLNARVDSNRGVHKAPAGTVDGRMLGALGVERKLTKGEMDLLTPANVNPIWAPKGRGVLLWGNRTMSTGSFRQANVRRVFISVKKDLYEGTLFVAFEPADADTRALVRKTVALYLLKRWRNKMLKGAKATDAFFVICDESNNPPSVEQAGQIICRVGMAVARPGEFIIFELVQDTRALEAELAAAGV